MLECTRVELTPIRTAARATQAIVARLLKKKHRAPLDQYFIDQLTYASWIQPSTHTRRLWLGLWTTETLRLLFPPALDLHSNMPTPDRYKYRSIARKLTAPLIYAYNKMIRLPHYTRTYVPHTHAFKNHKVKHHIASMIAQTSLPAHTSLSNITQNVQSNQYTYSDSAFSLTDAEVGIYKHIV
jgi:hypothetical protein